MDDFFYGPPAPTWIMHRDIAPPPLRPVEWYSSFDRSIRPVERVARRTHTVQSDLPGGAHPREEIHKVVEVPGPVPVHVPVSAAARPPKVAAERSLLPPQPIVHHHPIELKVPMCCEKCVKKVKERLLDLAGVESVVTDQYHQKVTVYGPPALFDPARVLHRVRLVKRRSAFWDFTVDYSETYRRYQIEAAAAAAAKSKSKSKSNFQAKLVAPLRSDLVVQLPRERRHGPRVSAILPEEEEHVPFIAKSRTHTVRYVSPPKAYVLERFFNPGF